MALLPSLDEELQAKILAYVTEPKASITCWTWKNTLYKQLHLDLRARFNLRLHEEGNVVFCYGAVRPLGEDFEESVSYNFAFLSNHTYKMQWTRTYDAWTSQTEQHFGAWHLFLDEIQCETLEPLEATSDREVRYAPPGFKFQVPVNDILKAKGVYFEAPIGAPAATWELPARTGKHENEGNSATTIGKWQSVERGSTSAQTFHAPLRANARFVEIDGEMHEVSGDIVDNWPETDWARLMKCRLRFGIVG